MTPSIETAETLQKKIDSVLRTPEYDSDYAFLNKQLSIRLISYYTQTWSKGSDSAEGISSAYTLENECNQYV